MIWSSDTELTDVSIFSDVPPISRNTIDIKPYLISMGEISWDLESTDEEDGKSNLFFEESDVKYEFDTLEDAAFLIDFFGIYRDTNREKYLIEVKDTTTNRYIHRGVVSQELIEIEYSPDADAEVLQITALGYLKELKTYYSTKPMLHNDTELVWTRQAELPNVIRRDGYNRWGCSMYDLLNQTFTATGFTFVLENDVAEWFIVKNPILAKRVNYSGVKPDNTCWIKSSYERIRANGENRFDLIIRVCNAMGWIFYFSDNNFYIKNRAPIETATEIDFTNVKNYIPTKQKDEVDYEHILIITGDVAVAQAIHDRGWGHMDGARLKIFTSLPTSRNERWWTNLPDDWNLFSSDIWGSVVSEVQKYYNEDNNYFRYCFITHTSPGADFVWYISTGNIYALKQNDILRIDSGDTGTSAWAYDGDNGSNFPREFNYNHGSENEVQFKGNYGTAMFKIEQPSNQVYTYEDYKESTTFNNNFQKFFRGNLSRRITITYDGVISNPLQKYTFINAPTELAGEWVTVSLKLDLNEEVSTLQLQLKE